MASSECSQDNDPKITVENTDFFYGEKQALFKVALTVPAHQVTAFIGPSGCGKSTLLRCFNRLNDLVEGARITGRICLDGKDIYASSVDVTDLRTRVGMVFQKVNPFPKSIYQNVVYGPQLQGVRRRSVLDGIVEKSLQGAGLWEEVKDRLHQSALGLSGGSNNACALHGRWPSTPKFSSWMSPVRRLIPSRPRRSKSCCIP